MDFLEAMLGFAMRYDPYNQKIVWTLIKKLHGRRAYATVSMEAYGSTDYMRYINHITITDPKTGAATTYRPLITHFNTDGTGCIGTTFPICTGYQHGTGPQFIDVVLWTTIPKRFMPEQ